MQLTKYETILAAQVALRLHDWTPARGCPAWVESRDETCQREVVTGTALCQRHRGVASKRLAKTPTGRRAEALLQADRDKALAFVEAQKQNI